MDTEVRHFFGQTSQVQLKDIYYLKTLNEWKGVSRLHELEKLLRSKWSLKLALMRSEQPYNFDQLDSEGIVEVSEAFYEIYLVTDVEHNIYFVIIRQNNFFPDGNNSELALTVQTVSDNAAWFRMFYKKLA